MRGGHRIVPGGRPVESGYISSLYGQRTDPFDGNQATHRGIDFAGAAGSQVLAVADGIVSHTGLDGGYGRMIEVTHGEKQPGHLLWRTVVEKCLQDATRGLPEAEAKRAVSVVQALFGAPAWRALRDRAGLSSREAAAAVAWAIEVLVRELRLRRDVTLRDEDDVP